MNSKEFMDWHRDLCERFPNLNQWFVNMDADQAKATTKAWFEALADCEFRDLIAVNSRMLRGEDPGPDDKSAVGAWQSLPAHLRRLAFAARQRREEAEEGAARLPRLDGARYRCGRCLDSGFVYVASAAAMQCVLQGRELLSCTARTAMARCTFCETGRRKGGREGDPRRDRVPEYDDRIHFLMTPGEASDFQFPPKDGGLALFEEFSRWVQAREKRLQGGGRYEEFDQYNEPEREEAV